MKWFLAVASLIYVLTATAENLLVVQSQAVYDLYGNTIAMHILEKEGIDAITVFNSRPFGFDMSVHSRRSLTRTVNALVERTNPNRVLFLGEAGLTATVPYKYSSILAGFNNANPTALMAFNLWNGNSNFYIVSGRTPTAELRLAALTDTLSDFNVKVLYATTVIELRTQVLAVQREPTGTLILNAFAVLDEWSNPIPYAEVEEIFVRNNSKHLDVGVCRRNFKTTLAIGPTPAEAAQIALSAYRPINNSYISSCANLRRVKAKWTMVYTASMGEFDLVQGGL